jgi:hypothetical protein
MVFNATFNNIFSYIVAVSFIGGGNRSTQRKPLTCHKQVPEDQCLVHKTKKAKL